MSTRLRLVACLAASAVLLAACGNGSEAIDETSVTGLAFDDGYGVPATTTTLIPAAPDVDLPEDDQGYVQFEAIWMCELQRRTFPTPEAIGLALDDKLDGLGLERDAYDEFRERVNTDQDLRDSILFAYQETCRP